MSAETLTALGVLAGAVVGALAAAAVRLLNASSANKQREQAGAVAHLEKIVARQEADIARHQAHDAEQQGVILRLQELTAVFRERLAEYRGRYELVYGYARRQAEAMKAAGLHPEPDPGPLPPPRPATDVQAAGEEIDFLVKQAEQSSAILRALGPRSRAQAKPVEAPRAEPGPGH
jgi:hypothetical protein